MAMDVYGHLWMTVDVYRCLWIAIDGDVYIVSVIKYFICTLHEVPISNSETPRAHETATAGD